MWPVLESRTRRHVWVKFVVGSFLALRGFSPGTPVFSSPQKPTFLNSNSIWNSRATVLSVARLLGVTLIKQSLFKYLYKQKNSPFVSSTVFETSGTVFPYTDRPRLVNVFIFFLPTVLARQSSQIAFQNHLSVKYTCILPFIVANWGTYNLHKYNPNSLPKIANYRKSFYQKQGWKIVVGNKELN